jgi:hypothetical protein
MNQEIYNRSLSFAHRMTLALAADHADALLDGDVVINAGDDVQEAKPKSSSLTRMLARKGRA